jgi:23S rRNA (cytidine1920-2'-O)/16S rRNA (cytidine1409-2'-O)-methyltransferase
VSAAGRGETGYVSRGGQKLEHALHTFDLDVTGLVCADFGASTGGFTDCLLRHGAARVTAVDTGYGVLAYELRRDERVEVRERENALHATPPEDGVDLVVIDLGWTPQRHALPAAVRWLRPAGRVVTLVKPHYELEPDERRDLLVDGNLDPAEAERIFARVLATLPDFGIDPRGHTRSPITGAKSSRRGRGNVEYLVWGTRRPDG